jgi:hypothetical protein
MEHGSSNARFLAKPIDQSAEARDSKKREDGTRTTGVEACLILRCMSSQMR